jgi:hypothetical protein
VTGEVALGELVTIPMQQESESIPKSFISEAVTVQSTVPASIITLAS